MPSDGPYLASLKVKSVTTLDGPHAELAGKLPPCVLLALCTKHDKSHGQACISDKSLLLAHSAQGTLLTFRGNDKLEQDACSSLLYAMHFRD